MSRPEHPGHESEPSVDVESPFLTDKDGRMILHNPMSRSGKTLMNAMGFDIGFDPLCRALDNAIKGRPMGYDPDNVKPFEDSDKEFAARLHGRTADQRRAEVFRVGDQVCKRFALRSNPEFQCDSDVGVVVGSPDSAHVQVQWDGPSRSVELVNHDAIRALPSSDPRHFTEGSQVQLFIYDDEWDRRAHTVVGFTADGDVQILRPLGSTTGIYSRWRIRKMPEHSDG